MLYCIEPRDHANGQDPFRNYCGEKTMAEGEPPSETVRDQDDIYPPTFCLVRPG